MREIKFRAWNGHKMYYDDLTVVGPDMGFNALIAKTGKIFNLMQYTGLKDQNGKEIYEGDIVRQGTHEISKVFFDNGSFMTFLEEGMWLEMSQNSFEFEIIGNIWENPKLVTPTPVDSSR
jgi:YopX protein